MRVRMRIHDACIWTIVYKTCQKSMRLFYCIFVLMHRSKLTFRFIWECTFTNSTLIFITITMKFKWIIIRNATQEIQFIHVCVFVYVYVYLLKIISWTKWLQAYKTFYFFYRFKLVCSFEMYTKDIIGFGWILFEKQCTQFTKHYCICGCFDFLYLDISNSVGNKYLLLKPPKSKHHQEQTNIGKL